MKIPSEFLLSDLLNHNVRSDQGIDHGPGIFAWMHPPVHRLLGWASRPSNLNLSRHVWRLDQLRGINQTELFVKGQPAESDQVTLDRFPTLIDAQMINRLGEKIAIIADFVFNPKTGKILYYLVSRSNPKLPGTSRWKLDLEAIYDQQPGIVKSNFLSLDELPILKASVRQEFLKKSQKFRNQIQEFSINANNKLEGWLEDYGVQPEQNNINSSRLYENTNYFENWQNEQNISSSSNLIDYDDNLIDDSFYTPNRDEDPWI